MATITRYSCAVCGNWYATPELATACANKDNALKAKIIEGLPATMTIKVMNTDVVYTKQA